MMQRFESALRRVLQFRLLHPDFQRARIEEFYGTLNKLAQNQEVEARVHENQNAEAPGIVEPLELLALDAFSHFAGQPEDGTAPESRA